MKKKVGQVSRRLGEPLGAKCVSLSTTYIVVCIQYVLLCMLCVQISTLKHAKKKGEMTDVIDMVQERPLPEVKLWVYIVEHYTYIVVLPIVLWIYYYRLLHSICVVCIVCTWCTWQKDSLELGPWSWMSGRDGSDSPTIVWLTRNRVACESDTTEDPIPKMSRQYAF